jgi:hypothetical protein
MNKTLKKNYKKRSNRKRSITKRTNIKRRNRKGGNRKRGYKRRILVGGNRDKCRIALIDLLDNMNIQNLDKKKIFKNINNETLDLYKELSELWNYRETKYESIYHKKLIEFLKECKKDKLSIPRCSGSSLKKKFLQATIIS